MHSTQRSFVILVLLAGCLLVGGPTAGAPPDTFEVPEAEEGPEANAAETDTNQGGQAAENPAAFKLLRTAGHAWISIVRQVEDHQLITLGDLVYLAASRQSVLRDGEIYPIYQSLDRAIGQPAAGSTGWLKQVGKLEILGGQEGLTIGRVVAARDIIQAGDQILLPAE